MKSNRLEWIDISKAIGILLVVIAHTFRGITASGIHGNKYLEIIDSVIYTFHMPLFFFISGLFFLGSVSKRTNDEFITNKVETIVYPYILWGLIQGLMIAYLASKGMANQDIKFVEVFQLWKPLGQFWFLHNLFFILIFTLVIYRLNFFKYKLFLLGIASILYLNPEFANHFFLTSILSKNWIFFLVGVFSKDIIKFLEALNTKYFLLLFSLVLLVQLYFHIALNQNYESKGIWTLFLAITSVLLVVKVSLLLQNRRLAGLLQLGQQSMAIYILHVFFASGCRIFLHKVLNVNYLWLDLIICSAIGIYIPLLIGVYVEKNNIKGVFSIDLQKRRSNYA